MKGQIVYIDEIEQSIEQAKIAKKSFEKFSWGKDIELCKGITPKTIQMNKYPWGLMKHARLQTFNKHKQLSKLSCIHNDLSFCEEIVDTNEPKCFFEQDIICIKELPLDETQILEKTQDFLFLSFEYAFLPPNILNNFSFIKKWFFEQWNVEKRKPDVYQFPSNYPLKYYKQNHYKNSFISPGLGAFLLTPNGAKKILSSAKKYGLEQGDMLFNSYNITMQYLYPSPIAYQKINLNLSHKYHERI